MPAGRESSADRTERFLRDLAAIGPHDHACLIYGSENEWKDAVIPFLLAGLGRGEKCIYVAEAHRAVRIRSLLRRRGIKVRFMERQGHLVILDSSEVYAPGGVFEPGRMVRHLVKETKQALSKGSPALRVSGEMAWALKGLPGTDRLLEYEARLNSELFGPYPCAALCQYDSRLFGPDIIKAVIMTHPLVVYRRAVLRNFYHISPADLPVGDRDPIEARLWLRNLQREQRLETERRKAQENLRESEERFRAIFANSMDAILLTSPDGGILAANTAACRMFQRSEEEMKRIGRAGLVDASDGRVEAAVRERSEKRWMKGEIGFIRKDGTRFTGEYSSSIFTDTEGRERTSLVIRDVTERVRLEQEVEERSDELESIYGNAPVAMLLVDSHWTIRKTNVFASTLTGTPLGQAVNVRCGELLRCVHSLDSAEGCGFGPFCAECRLRRSVVETIETGEGRRGLEAKFTVSGLDGTTECVVLFSAARVTIKGEPLALVIMEDITGRTTMEEALRRSESAMRVIADGVPALVSYVDSTGRYGFANARYEDWFGVPGAAVIGRHYGEILGPEAAGKIEGYVRAVMAGRKVSFEEVLPYARGGERWVHADYVPDVTEDGEVRGYFGLVTDITEHKQTEMELRASREQMRVLAAHLQTVREQERARIAREIHDELGQSLTGIKIDVAWLRTRLAAEGWLTGKLKDRTDTLAALIDSTIQATREISLSLRPGILDDLGIVAALAWQVRRFQATTGISCTYFTDVERSDIEDNCATALFRICQECLTNVARHADATEVSVSLIERDGRLVLRVEDDGRGLPETQAESPPSLGILGMRERILNLGGTFSVKAGPLRGTIVRAEVPVA